MAYSMDRVATLGYHLGVDRPVDAVEFAGSVPRFPPMSTGRLMTRTSARIRPEARAASRTTPTVIESAVLGTSVLETTEPVSVSRLMSVSRNSLRDLLSIATVLLSLVLSRTVAVVAADRERDAAAKIEFNRDVRPILADNCFACHGPDSASRKAGLRLDRRDDAVASGAIVPGDVNASELLERVSSSDPDHVMPPPKTQKQLTDAERELLRRWIAEGAEYQRHWSFIVPVRPEIPVLEHAETLRNPIDAFIVERLRSIDLEPAPEADRRTIARRVSLDLTGLPPEPSLVEDFVRDETPNAYEKLVDRVLDSVHWGEHRGRYWLDYARYADTHGIHFDNYREMWSYRDWVIRAFNRNLPWDQFTIESLAGDLLPNPTLDQIVASGFNRCNMTTNEGGIIDEEYRVLYTRDRTEATSTVWLGLTANCAVCHDHKFDPLTQREFYELSAFFNNTTQGARDGNIKDTPPIVFVPTEEDRERWTLIDTEIARAKAALDARREGARDTFAAWLADARPDESVVEVPRDALHLEAGLDEGEGGTVEVALEGATRDAPIVGEVRWVDGPSGSRALRVRGTALELADVGDFERDQAFTCVARIKLPRRDQYGAICARMDNSQAYRGWDFWVDRGRIGTHIVGKWPESGLKAIGREPVPADRWTHVAVSYDGSGKASGVRVYYDGVQQALEVQNDTLAGSTRSTVPFKIGQRHSSEPIEAAIQDLRIYRRALSPAEVEAVSGASRAAAILAKGAEDRSESETNELYRWWLESQDTEFAALTGEVVTLEKEKAVIRSRGTIAHVMQETDGAAEAYILFRGEYDKRRDRVTADTPDILPQFTESTPRNRLGFAQWLVRPDQPLTARVTVNRFWQEIFGVGLVRTAGDFGVSGELPSHPELLDWLAVEFIESGWNVKRLFKLIVMSATYRQSAATTPEKLAKDRDNRLLSRGPRFRMDAEMVRDYALEVSGLLVRELGGPSVKPYQPPGVWEAIAMDVSNTRSYAPDSGEGLYRRSLYTFWKRMAPPASMDIFNAPNRELCVVRRERTNTPLQALVTLNDEQFVEAARHLAEIAILGEGKSVEERVDRFGRRLLARPFRDEEVEVLRSSLDDLLTYYRENPEDARLVAEIGVSRADPSIDPVELAAWTLLANQLFNLDEVLNK
jgi:mono/diheme cytochrome c family protein